MSRIAKLVRTLKKYENFAALKPLLSLGTLVGIILLAAHLLACFWYLIGTWDQVIQFFLPFDFTPLNVNFAL